MFWPRSARPSSPSCASRGAVAPLDAVRAVEDHHAIGQRLHRAAHARERVGEAFLALRRVALEAVQRGEQPRPRCPGPPAPCRAAGCASQRSAAARGGAHARAGTRTGRRRARPSPRRRRARGRSAPPARRAPGARAAYYGRSIGAEAVPRAAHRVDQAVVAGRLERLAQAPDVHVDRALLDEHVVAPDMVEQLRAGIDAVRGGS